MACDPNRLQGINHRIKLFWNWSLPGGIPGISKSMLQ